MALTNNISDLFKKSALKSIELRAYNRILDVTDECTNWDNFEPDLKTKIYNLLYSKEVAPSLKINTKQYSDENLLGISLEPIELTNEERQKLIRVVHLKLLSSTYNPNKNRPKLTENFNFLKLNPADKTLLDLRTKLIDTQQRCLENYLAYQKILDTVLEIKLDRSKNLVDKKIKGSELTAKTLKLKMDILRQKTTIRVFTEIPIARQAYQMVYEDILKQQNKCKEEIKDLKELKRKYKVVSCKQFDEILNSYRSYKSAIIKKKEILEKIK